MPAEPPAEFQQLLDEADRLLEEADCPGAVRAFRAAALLAPLPDWAAQQLGVAEDIEALDFRRRVARLFPKSLDAALAEVASLVRGRFLTQAIARCTELLARPGLTDREIRSIRAARFRVAEDRNDPTSFALDFAYFWGLASPRTEWVRLSLLRAVVTLHKPRMLDALAEIRDRFGEDADLARIVAIKVEQLTTLARIKAALPRPGDTRPDGDRG